MKEVMANEELIRNLDAWQIIDVRSPSEFRAGHIPGAINIPLFSDEERAIIGTLYKQKSPESAFTEGLRIAGLKIPDLVGTIREVKQLPGRKTLIHCWRGGKRSQAIQWLFSFSGIESHRLEGGYKHFRNLLLSFFNESRFQFRIVGGCTGAGKTEVLQVLAERGEQVIDLEKMAHHKGSAFGSIGEEEQPTTEQFENDLYLTLLNMDTSRPVWLENESKSIGRVHIPDGLWQQMRNSMLYTLEVGQETRLQRSMRYYSEPVNTDALRGSFEKIKKRLGGLDFQAAVKALEVNDLFTAAAVALKYYDKAYTFQLNHWPAERVVYLTGCEDVEETAERLLNLKTN